MVTVEQFDLRTNGQAQDLPISDLVNFGCEDYVHS